MNVVTMNYDQAHKFVASPPRRTDVRWDGYTMVFWKPTPFGYTSPKGAFRKGRWGVEQRVEVASNGTWEVPGAYVRPTK